MKRRSFGWFGRRVAGVVVLALALTGCFDNMYPTDNYHAYCAGFSSPTPASHFCRTDGQLLTYFYQGTVGEGDKTNIRLGLDQYEPTDLDPQYESPAVYSAAQETDIIFQKAVMAENDIGVTYCEDESTTLTCDQTYIRFNNSRLTGRMAGCHEVGHAVGLTHGEESSPIQAHDNSRLGCMVHPEDNLMWKLGAQNVGGINGAY